MVPLHSKKESTASLELTYDLAQHVRSIDFHFFCLVILQIPFEHVWDIAQRAAFLRLLFFRSYVIYKLNIAPLITLVHHKVNLQLLTDTLALFIFIKDLHDAHINIVATNQQLVINKGLHFSNHSMTDCQLCNQKKENKKKENKKKKNQRAQRRQGGEQSEKKASIYILAKLVTPSGIEPELPP